MDHTKLLKGSLYTIKSPGETVDLRLALVDQRYGAGAHAENPAGGVFLGGRDSSINAPLETIVKPCKILFREVMNEDQAAWDALGEEYHQRLGKEAENYVTWVCEYITVFENGDWEGVVKANATIISWGVGGQMPMGFFFKNAVLATKYEVQVELSDCKHFPQVSIPEKLAEWIKTCCDKAEADCCFTGSWD